MVHLNADNADLNADTYHLFLSLEICRQCRRKLEEELQKPIEKTATEASNVIVPSPEKTPKPITTTEELAAACIYEEFQERKHTKHTEATIDAIKVRTAF
jgi:hypothetical protein